MPLGALQKIKEVLTAPQTTSIQIFEMLTAAETLEILGRLRHLGQEESDYMIQI